MGCLPVANQANVAAGQINLVVPICGVQQGAFVLLDTWNRRPLPVVENTACVNEDVAVVIHNLTAREVLDTHIVAASGIVPDSAIYLMLGLDVLV